MLTAYEESLKNLWDLNNCLETAERKGKEEGRAEVARTMKQAGISSEEISKFTGLPITTIENL